MGFEDIEFIPSEYGGWGAEVVVAERTIALSVEEGELSAAVQEQIGIVIGGIERLDEIARNAMLDASADDDEDFEPVSLFVSHHIEELPNSDLDGLFGTRTPTTEVFLSKLVLREVSFHPDDLDEFVWFDYTLPGDVTDQVIVVRFDGEGNAVSIDTES
jgi:hypothetical protein